MTRRKKRGRKSRQPHTRPLEDLLRNGEHLHPNYYPSPVDLGGSSAGREPADRMDGFLSEDKLIEVYGRLGNILHAENPMGRETDYRFFMDAVPGWLSEVMVLLECHKVYLYHRPDEFYLIKMFGVKGGVIMDRRGGGERPGVALQNWTTRRLL